MNASMEAATMGNQTISFDNDYRWFRQALRYGLVATVAITLSGTASFAQGNNAMILHGAGSTFAAPLFKKWIDEYSVSHRNVTVTYDAVGSGEGVKRFLAESVDFAGSDEILSESEIAKVPGAIMLPIAAGMIALAYNIPGVNSEIKLPRDVYVEIFAGKIRKWDDPRIQAANPGIAFPRRDIALVARQDSSGTTAAFTNHLAAIGPAWQAAGMGVGKLIDWPAGILLAPGNEGVAARIRLSEGSIGYVEYWFAQRLGLRMPPDKIDWSLPERQTRAVAEFLTAFDDEDTNPDRKLPKVISPVDPCSAWTAKANKRVQFGYGLNYLIDIENAVIIDVEATRARTYDEVAATKS
jgi:ABC-type phosphate transport system substrate-binding protein